MDYPSTGDDMTTKSSFLSNPLQKQRTLADLEIGELGVLLHKDWNGIVVLATYCPSGKIFVVVHSPEIFKSKTYGKIGGYFSLDENYFPIRYLTHGEKVVLTTDDNQKWDEA